MLKGITPNCFSDAKNKTSPATIFMKHPNPSSKHIVSLSTNSQNKTLLTRNASICTRIYPPSYEQLMAVCAVSIILRQKNGKKNTKTHPALNKQNRLPLPVARIPVFRLSREGHKDMWCFFFSLSLSLYLCLLLTKQCAIKIWQSALRRAYGRRVGKTLFNLSRVASFFFGYALLSLPNKSPHPNDGLHIFPWQTLSRVCHNRSILGRKRFPFTWVVGRV